MRYSMHARLVSVDTSHNAIGFLLLYLLIQSVSHAHPPGVASGSLPGETFVIHDTGALFNALSAVPRLEGLVLPVLCRAEDIASVQAWPVFAPSPEGVHLARIPLSDLRHNDSLSVICQLVSATTGRPRRQLFLHAISICVTNEQAARQVSLTPRPILRS